MIKSLDLNTLSKTCDEYFDAIIAKGLRTECEKLTGINEDFKEYKYYVNIENETVGGIIGYNHGNILWIDSIYVDKKQRNKGVGSKLIAAITNEAQGTNIKEIQLNTYFPEAHKFFEHLGFETVATIPNWKYDLTCYFMRIVL